MGSFCQRHARATALTSVPSGCGFALSVSSLPSGVTMRLRPASALECHRDADDQPNQSTPPPSLLWLINRREG
jgi:hypothetical protein